MNATKKHIGKNTFSKSAKTKTTAPTVGRIFRMDETAERCRRSTQRPQEIRSDNNASNGFLKCRFLPKLKESQSVEDCTKDIKTERDFYHSLFRLAEHYAIESTQTRHFGYPYNIALALEDIRKQLKNKVKNWEEIRLIEEKNKTYFTSEERYNTGQTLYYIPILPLYKLSKIKTVNRLYSYCNPFVRIFTTLWKFRITDSQAPTCFGCMKWQRNG